MGPFCQGSCSAGWGQGCALSNWFPFHVPASPGAFCFASPWLQHRHGQPAGSALGFAPGDSPLPLQSISPGCIHGVLLLADKELGTHRERLPGVQVRAAIPIPSLSPPQGPPAWGPQAGPHCTGAAAPKGLLGSAGGCLPDHCPLPDTGVGITNLRLTGLLLLLVLLCLINIM